MEAQICWKLNVNSTYADKLLEYSTQQEHLEISNLDSSTMNPLNVSDMDNMTAVDSETFFPACRVVNGTTNILLQYDEIMDIKIWKPRVSYTFP